MGSTEGSNTAAFLAIAIGIVSVLLSIATILVNR